MKTNKLIAGFMAVSVVVAQFGAIVPTLSVHADNAENAMAYEFAYDNGLTSMTSLSAFNFDGTTTREAAARFLVKGAEALGAELSSDQSCEYKDLDTADQSLVEYINAGCEMGIFKAQDNFNPKGTFTRAQAELTVARIVFGMDVVLEHADENDLSEYASARELLMDSEIITVAVNSDSAVKRGHLLLMLYRLADMDLDTDTGTGTVATGTDTNTSVKAGELDVALNAATAATNTSVPANTSAQFAKVDLTAGSSDVVVQAIEVSNKGLTTNNGIESFSFEKNGITLTSKASPSSEGKTMVTFKTPLIVKAGSTETVDFYVSLATSGGTDYQFAMNAFDTSAKTVNGTITTPVLRTTNYTVATAELQAAGSTSTYKAGEKNVEVAAFKVAITDSKAETVKAKFQAVTFKNEGNSDLAKGLANLYVERNGTKVESTITVNGDYVTIVFPNQSIEEGKDATYYLRADTIYVDNAGGDTYIFKIKKYTDISFVEEGNNFRTKVSGGEPYTAKTYTVNGGDIRFERDNTISLSSTVAEGTNEVTLLQGKIVATQSVNLEDVKSMKLLFANGSGVSSGVAINSVIKTLYLNFGGQVVSSTVASDGTVNFTVAKNNIKGDVAVRVYGNVQSNALGNSATQVALKLDNAFGLDNIDTKEYVSNDAAVTASVGEIDPITVTVRKSQLDADRNDAIGSTVNVVRGVATKKLVYGVKFYTSQSNKIKLNKISVNVTGGVTTGLNNADATLTVNGTDYVGSISNGKVEFNSINADVTNTTSGALDAKLSLKVNSSAVTGDAGRLYFDFTAVDTVTSKEITDLTAQGAMVTVKATPEGTVTSTSSASNTLSKILYSALSENVGALTLEAKNDDLKVEEVYMIASGVVNLQDYVSSIKLVDSSNSAVWNGKIYGNNKIKFVNGSSIVMTSTPKTFVVNATMNNDMPNLPADVKFNLVLDTTTLGDNGDASNGMKLTSNGLRVSPTATTSLSLSAEHRVVRSAVQFAKTSGSRDTSNAYLTFSATKKGGAKVTLKDLNLYVTFNAFSGANVNTVSLYDGNDTSNTVLATGTVASNGVVSFTNLSKEITSSANLTVKYDLQGNTIANASNPSIVIRLTNASYLDDYVDATDGLVSSLASFNNLETIFSSNALTN